MNGNQQPKLAVIRKNIMAAEDLFVSNLGSLKGNTRMRKSSVAVVTTVTTLPDIKGVYINMNLTLDIMFMNKVTFVMIYQVNLN